MLVSMALFWSVSSIIGGYPVWRKCHKWMVYSFSIAGYLVISI